MTPRLARPLSHNWSTSMRRRSCAASWHSARAPTSSDGCATTRPRRLCESSTASRRLRCPPISRGRSSSCREASTPGGRRRTEDTVDHRRMHICVRRASDPGAHLHPGESAGGRPSPGWRCSGGRGRHCAWLVQFPHEPIAVRPYVPPASLPTPVCVGSTSTVTQGNTQPAGLASSTARGERTSVTWRISPEMSTWRPQARCSIG